MKTIEEHLGRELPFVREVCDRFTLDSQLYQIDDGLLAKVYHEGINGDSSRAERIALHEHGIAKRLYDNGVSVPRPEGVFLSPTEMGSTKRYPSFVMEYVLGHTLRDLEDLKPKDKANEVARRAKIELEKAVKLGFVPKDLCGGNVLWSPQTDKVYLIDFTEWKDGAGS